MDFLLSLWNIQLIYTKLNIIAIIFYDWRLLTFSFFFLCRWANTLFTLQIAEIYTFIRKYLSMCLHPLYGKTTLYGNISSLQPYISNIKAYAIFNFQCNVSVYFKAIWIIYIIKILSVMLFVCNENLYVIYYTK